jgi:hypothetical protein
MALDPTELAQIVSAVLTAIKTNGAAPSAKPHSAPTNLASRDQQILNAFHRKGFKDVVLMDRSDKSKAFNVKPFKSWLDEGRVVRKGQKSVKGLFHITQTDALPVKAEAKPALTVEQKTLFRKAKAALKAKQAQSTLPLA